MVNTWLNIVFPLFFHVFFRGFSVGFPAARAKPRKAKGPPLSADAAINAAVPERLAGPSEAGATIYLHGKLQKRVRLSILYIYIIFIQYLICI
jgi:hypothetical protein